MSKQEVCSRRTLGRRFIQLGEALCQSKFARRVGRGALWIALITFGALSSSYAIAADADAEVQPVELLFSQHDFNGSIGGKAIRGQLTRLGEKVNGHYCYEPCKSPWGLRLKGRIDANGAVQLVERDDSNAKVPSSVTGSWDFSFQGSAKAVDGTWRSPKDQRTASIHWVATGASRALPYEMRLLLSRLPDDEEDCSFPVSVMAIRLYEGGRLVQELPADSDGTCHFFLPDVVDANFDGWPDLMLVIHLPASPNIPYQYWLFDPKTRRMKDGPESLHAVTSPVFDAKEKRVWSSWRASCCEHGVSVWEWDKGELKEVDMDSSFTLPVIDKGKRLDCYVTPDYAAGHVVFEHRVEQEANGALRLTFDPASTTTRCSCADPANNIKRRHQGGPRRKFDEKP